MSTATFATVWQCAKCGERYETPIPALEVFHACRPTDTDQPTRRWLRPVREEIIR